mgnify:CR=1 FL=1
MKQIPNQSFWKLWNISFGFFGVQIACQQTFVALGNAKTSLFLAALRKIILLVPLIYILPCFFADKAFAVFLAEPVADFPDAMERVLKNVKRRREENENEQ